jgi:molybdopterin-containing oxidoreductase family iron-sulfur binding subunit
VESLLADMREGRIGVLLLDDVNPAYALPKDARVAEALASVDLVVSLSGYPDESNASAHLVLPTSSTLEDWGDEEPQRGLYLLRQPAMAPLHDTRSLGDILLETARSAGLTPLPSLTPSRAAEIDIEEEVPAEPEDEQEEAPAEPLPGPLGFEPETWRDYLVARWEREILPMHAMGRQFAFAEWWRLALIDGFLRLHKDEISGRSFDLTNPTVMRTDWSFSGVAEFEGDGDLFLHLYPHPFRMDGRFANEPWAQETGDPMTGQTWDSWLEVAPAAAKRLGLADNDRVEIISPHGTLSLGVHVYPGVRRDTVAIAFGQGHTALGRYAGFGVNVVDLLAAGAGGTRALAWQQVRVKLRKGAGQALLAPTVGSTRLEGRQLAPLVSATALAEKGDAPDEHPGALTGIHHLERDPRLIKAGIEDFYEAPDHPVHRWALTVDSNACNGCGICVIACYAENNIPVVGKDLVRRGKEMNWLRINRYWHDAGGQPSAQFLPVMCQQCTRAPCESVCPVLATYHNHEGLNAMIYNRCVGTRYCANNCPYQARRFNFHSYVWPEPFNLQLNPDVAVRTMGIMEKCTFCAHRIREVKGALKDRGHEGPVPDEHVQQLPACAEVCPSQALTLGNLKDESSVPAKTRHSARSYIMLEELRVEPGVNYLARASFHLDAPHGVEHLGAAPGDDHNSNEPASNDAGSH